MSCKFKLVRCFEVLSYCVKRPSLPWESKSIAIHRAHNYGYNLTDHNRLGSDLLASKTEHAHQVRYYPKINQLFVKVDHPYWAKIGLNTEGT